MPTAVSKSQSQKVRRLKIWDMLQVNMFSIKFSQVQAIPFGGVDFVQKKPSKMFVLLLV
jgi:hypothetical protein